MAECRWASAGRNGQSIGVDLLMKLVERQTGGSRVSKYSEGGEGETTGDINSHGRAKKKFVVDY